MKDEIKEIYLSNLEWTKTHDNIGGVMGNLIFKDNMPYEEYEKLLKSGYFVLCNKDYITNLQDEYEKEHYLVDKLTRQLNDEYKNTEYQCKQKENIIKEVRKIFKYYGNKEDIVGYANYTITGESLLELLEILDKENNNETI